MFNILKTFIKKNFTVDVRHSNPGFMFGVSTDEWRYIGYAEIKTYQGTTYTHENLLDLSFVFFFAEKGNEEDGKRMYVQICNDEYYGKKHKFMYTVAEPWQAGEHSLVFPIITMPSDWTKNRAYKDGMIWDNDQRKFIMGSKENQKYNEALNSQKKQKKDVEKTVVEAEDNVVKLNFSKE